MTKRDKVLDRMRNSPGSVRFDELAAVCDHYFGEPRRTGGSHHVYAMPWPGDPRVNIQNSNGRAKAYQVKQDLEAIDRLEAMHEENDPSEEEK
ncbi:MULTISPECIES: toxin HicA [Cellulosimicrobium]|uniref:toxin HicA n=1 Tax=Cellulosimicrobium TaxID=157920 RepID=UPI0002D5D071|nr:toxin HicA [Cellulosimicrobium cellulans]